MRAQPDAFVDGVRALIEAKAQTGPARAAHVSASAERMRLALIEWDRLLDEAQTRVDLEAASDAVGRVRDRRRELGLAYRLRGRLDDAARELDTAAHPADGAERLLLRALTHEAAGRASAGALFAAAFTADASGAVHAYYALERDALDPGMRARARAALDGWYERLDVHTARATRAPFPLLDALPDTFAPAPLVAGSTWRDAFASFAAGRLDDAVRALGSIDAGAADEGGPRASLLRAQRDEAEGRVGDARRGYSDALKGTLAGRHLLWTAIARLAQVEGDTAGAIAAFRAAARLAPGEARIHKELAGAYLAESRHDDAAVALAAALLLEPRDGHAHAALGGVFLDAGRPADAVVALTRAIELSPERHEARYALARALTQLGRSEEAARQLALFDTARRAALERRRAGIAREVEREEAARGGRAPDGGAR